MANDIKILSCPICNNSRWTNCGNGIHQCDICETYFDKDENILMTEQEWLQTCTTEELAEFIRKQRDDWSDGWYSDWHKTEEIIEWLKQPHKE